MPGMNVGGKKSTPVEFASAAVAKTSSKKEKKSEKKDPSRWGSSNKRSERTLGAQIGQAGQRSDKALRESHVLREEKGVLMAKCPGKDPGGVKKKARSCGCTCGAPRERDRTLGADRGPDGITNSRAGEGRKRETGREESNRRTTPNVV